jgi:hypothetical protein
VNGFAVPDWEVARSAQVVAPFASGAYALEVGVSEVPSSSGWAQLFALTDGMVPPNVELALVGCTLQLQTRVRASRLRLGTLMLVAPDACAERGEGLRVIGRLDKRVGLVRLQQGDQVLSHTSASLTPAALWRLLLPFAGLGRHEVPWTLLWTAGWGALASLAIPRRGRRGNGARIIALAGAMLAIEAVAALLWDVAWPGWTDAAGIMLGACSAERLVRQLQTSAKRPDRPRTPFAPQEGPA